MSRTSGFESCISVVRSGVAQRTTTLPAASVCAFGWPGAFGTWWQADPANDLVILYLIQNSVPLDPGAIATLAAGQRMGARAALPIFQRLVYDAIA